MKEKEFICTDTKKKTPNEVKFIKWMKNLLYKNQTSGIFLTTDDDDQKYHT